MAALRATETECNDSSVDQGKTIKVANLLHPNFLLLHNAVPSKLIA